MRTRHRCEKPEFPTRRLPVPPKQYGFGARCGSGETARVFRNKVRAASCFGTGPVTFAAAAPRVERAPPPPATLAPRRAHRPSRRAPRADSSSRGERVAMSAALGTFAARRVRSAHRRRRRGARARSRSSPSVAGHAAPTAVDARPRRRQSRVTHRAFRIASHSAASPRLPRRSRAPRVPRRAHAHR